MKAAVVRGVGTMGLQMSERVERLPPFLFMETRRRVREAVARGVDVISLGVGDPDQPTPAHVVEALAAAAADPANHRYPTGEARGMPAFREAVARYYQRRFGVALDPATEVLALIGSKEGCHHLSLGVLDPGDAAVVPDPGYPAYEASACIAGARVVRLPLRRANGFLPDLAELPEETLRRAKLLWLSYPNNPTTAVAPRDFLRAAVELAHRHDLVLVNDNPYAEIAFDGVLAPSILEVDGARDVAVELNSLSKTYNMTGWRLGMAVGNADLVAAMARVKENTDVGVFNAVQHAGIAALDGPQDALARAVATYQRRRDRVVDGLRVLGLEVDPPQATFYVWLPVPGGLSSTDFAARLLELTGVVVTPGVGYGEHGEGFVRLALSVPDDRLDEALRRMASVRDRLF
jgi:LL-diaminopimelate aminotransferase